MLFLTLLALSVFQLFATSANLIQIVSASSSPAGANQAQHQHPHPHPHQHQNQHPHQNQQALSAAGSNSVIIAPNSGNAKARYKTMYACEDRQLTMDCDYGSKINLIRANYGRFSITQCNEQGQLDLSTDCMSPITFRIMRERCQDKQKCSVNATSSIFGDKCPKTRKYLEVHFQCQPDPRAISEPPDRVDLRNSSSSAMFAPAASPVGALFVPPTSTSGASGSSSILPPNNPTASLPARPQVPAPASNTNGHRAQTQTQTQPQPQPQPQPQVQPDGEPAAHLALPPMAVMNSEIVSYNSLVDLRFYNPANSTPTEPILVTLKHIHVENMSNPRCVLWDSPANTWTERGSQIIESNQTHTVCAFDQPSTYLLVMDYIGPNQTISPTNLSSSKQQNSNLNPSANPNQNPNNNYQPQMLPAILTQPSVPEIFNSPLAGMLNNQPVEVSVQSAAQANAKRHFLSGPTNQQQQQQQQPPPNGPADSTAAPVGKFFALFGYLLASAFVVVASLTVVFVVSSMRSSTGAALKSLGNFTAFGGPKSKGRRADAGGLRNKDLLVINNQNGHQFLYAPASTTKISSSASTHILTGATLPGSNQLQQGTLHQIQQSQQQQQQQTYSGNGTLSNLSAAGAQSNNYYYGLMGFTNIYQQQQQQSQLHHLSQHHLNQIGQQQQQQPLVNPASYQHQANKSTLSTESANSSPSSSGVESGSTGMHQQQQQQQQQACLGLNGDYNLLGHLGANCGQQQQQQPTLTLNAHYSSSGLGGRSLAAGGSVREHIYESVEDDRPYTARLLLPANDQFAFLHQHQHQHQHQQMNSSRALTLSSRMLQNPSIQQQQSPNGHQTAKRASGSVQQPAIVRDQNAAKTNIICSQLAQVNPQRATEIGGHKFHHDVMTIYGLAGETNSSSGNSSANSSSAHTGASCYARADLTTVLCSPSGKLSTDC